MNKKFLQGALFSLVAVMTLIQPLGSKQARACPADQFVASICIFAGDFSIVQWAFADGRLLPINQNTALFSLVSTFYGGDGITTFALPDLRGRTPIGFGNGPGLRGYAIGASGGAETVTLTTSQLPSHNHTATLQASGQEGNRKSPINDAALAGNCCERGYDSTAPNVDMNAASIVLGGSGGLSHENRPPYLAVNYLIALQGVFPPRN